MTKHGLSLLERVALYHATAGKNECWIWKGALNTRKYPAIYRKKGTRLVHRIMYETYKGKIKKGLEIRHTCDTPTCINPNHLLAGTHIQNMQDASQRKRFPDRRGEAGTLAKLTSKQVKAIRKDKRGSNALAIIYKVDRTLIWQIRANKIWTHI